LADSLSSRGKLPPVDSHHGQCSTRTVYVQQTLVPGGWQGLRRNRRPRDRKGTLPIER